MTTITLTPSVSSFGLKALFAKMKTALTASKKETITTQFTDTSLPGELLRPLGVQFINNGFHESMIEELRSKSFMNELEEGKDLVIYNSSSIDSMFAAGILASLDTANELTFVSYNPLAHELPKMAGYRHLVVVGVELLEDDLKHIMLEEKFKHVTIFGYRDSYGWLETDKALVNERERMSVFKPWDIAHENYGELVNRTDNTAIRLVSIYGRLAMKNFEDVVSKDLLDVSVLASRMVSLAFPVAPLDYPCGANTHADKDFKEGETLEPMIAEKKQREQMELFRDFELRNRAQVFNMTQQLRRILPAAQSHEQVHKVMKATGSMVYSIMENDARTTINRSLIKDFVSGAPVIYASESQNTIMMGLLVNIYKSFITYEDQRGFRVWRIFSKDADHAKKLGARFNHKGAWSDGACWCVVTDLPAVQFKPAGKA